MSLSHIAEKFPPGSLLCTACLSLYLTYMPSVWEPLRETCVIFVEGKWGKAHFPLPFSTPSCSLLWMHASRRCVHVRQNSAQAGRGEVALICKICSVFILGMVVMGWGRGRGYGMSLHFITAWALALSFGTCHESKESLALITSHKYCTASDFRDGWQQARNYNELLQMPSSHKLQLFSSEPASLPTSGFWFRR